MAQLGICSSLKQKNEAAFDIEEEGTDKSMIHPITLDHHKISCNTTMSPCCEIGTNNTHRTNNSLIQQHLNINYDKRTHYSFNKAYLCYL